MRGRNGHLDGSNKLFAVVGQRLAIFEEAFKMALDGFSGVGSRFFQRFTLAVAAWQSWAGRIVAARFVGFNDDREVIHLRCSDRLHGISRARSIIECTMNSRERQPWAVDGITEPLAMRVRR